MRLLLQHATRRACPDKLALPSLQKVVLLATGWNDVPSSGGGLYGKPPLSRLPQRTGEMSVVMPNLVRSVITI